MSSKMCIVTYMVNNIPEAKLRIFLNFWNTRITLITLISGWSRSIRCTMTHSYKILKYKYGNSLTIKLTTYNVYINNGLLLQGVLTTQTAVHLTFNNYLFGLKY